jgi:caffeoyl-CoA O-methyltransferase
MELVNAQAELYAENITSSQNDVLQQVYEKTIKEHPHAHMVSSLSQGMFLQFISKIIQPTYVLEIGTFTGFSALCLAEGLTHYGVIHTIELREADALTAKANFKAAEKDNRINLHIGNAHEIIPNLQFEWDIVFIDADKVSYIDYYEMVLPRLKQNGLIIADNVLFHGQVLNDTISGKNAKAIDAFNKHVAADFRTEQVLLTIRDGLLLIKKK